MEGWQADVAYDGYRGVQMASEQDYDVVVMDILMPRMTGIEATREIIKRKSEANIIVITGAPYRKQAEEALEGGAKLFIKKPFSSSQIINAVKGLLKNENRRLPKEH
jgi:DNA-binding response OmpR family regulator